MNCELCVDGHVLYEFLYFEFFFFQAEDGIRDLVRSRGLGDVYKRQAPSGSRRCRNRHHAAARRRTAGSTGSRRRASAGTVSYTHLTLPTIYSV